MCSKELHSKSKSKTVNFLSSIFLQEKTLTEIKI